MAFSWFKTPFFMVQRGDPCENHENARFHGSGSMRNHMVQWFHMVELWKWAFWWFTSPFSWFSHCYVVSSRVMPRFKNMEILLSPIEHLTSLWSWEGPSWHPWSAKKLCGRPRDTMRGCNSVFVGFPEFSEFLFPRFKNMETHRLPCHARDRFEGLGGLSMHEIGEKKL